jgi:hypothetical protein
MKFCLNILSILIICNTVIYSQSFKEKVETIYNFKIAALTPEEALKKNEELRLFWNEMDNDTAYYLPQIRKVLTIPNQPSYLYFDLCSYLDIQSFKSSDNALIEQAIAHINWVDMNQWELIEKYRTFALSGINVVNGVKTLFKTTKINVLNPTINKTFNQGEIAAYLLLPLKPQKYVTPLAEIYDTISTEAQRTVITIMWLSNTQVGDEKLQLFAKITKDIDARSYANRLLYRFSPSQELIAPFAAMNEQQRTADLMQNYFQSVAEWKSDSWEKIIQSTQLMHYFKLARSL